jgi:hypothetical protein
MAQSTEFVIGPSAFDDFLFGPIGEEANGMTLSVFSGLARLGVDPWEEAARLASLPGPAAIEALARVIAGLAGGSWRASDAPRIAARLVLLLPKHGAAASAQSPSRAPRKAPRRAPTWLIVLLLAALATVTIVTIYQGSAAPGSDQAPISADRRR